LDKGGIRDEVEQAEASAKLYLESALITFMVQVIAGGATRPPERLRPFGEQVQAPAGRGLGPVSRKVTSSVRSTMSGTGSSTTGPGSGGPRPGRT